MKKNLAPLLVSVFVLSIFSFQIIPVVHAQKGGVTQETGGGVTQDTGGGVTQDSGVVLENPLGDTDTIPLFIEKLLGLVMKIGVPIVALFIIYSGFLFVLARGKPAELTKAKDTFLYTVLGAAILLGAWVLAQAINGTVEALK